jgi:glycerate 2-kinase
MGMANIKEPRPAKQVAENLAERRARRLLRAIYEAAVSAAQPPVLLQKRLKISGGDLVIETARGRSRFPLTGRVYVVGVGKGADVSGRFWRALLGDRLEQSIFVVRDRIVRGKFKRSAILPAGHPLPDHRSLRATRRCLEMLGRAGRGDCVIVFLMGGASSLLAQPAGGITLKDKRAAATLLLQSGMDIREMNCVRKHISAVKAGGLLRAAYPARVLTLGVSDVIGDDPSVIGSAPSFHDPTTFDEAWTILKKHHLTGKIPRAVKTHLRRGIRGEIPETLKPGSLLSRRSPCIVIANNQTSLLAAKSKAAALGFSAKILTAELAGDARSQAREICRQLKSILKAKHPPRGPLCLLLGGETTVGVKGKGLGGRNQEFALACALELAGLPGIYLLCAASDGSDGPTDAAGAFVDGDTIARALKLGVDPHRALRDNDSYHFFESVGGLFRPGPTGTNVLDFVIALVH